MARDPNRAGEAPDGAAGRGGSDSGQTRPGYALGGSGGDIHGAGLREEGAGRPGRGDLVETGRDSPLRGCSRRGDVRAESGDTVSARRARARRRWIAVKACRAFLVGMIRRQVAQAAGPPSRPTRGQAMIRCTRARNRRQGRRRQNAAAPGPLSDATTRVSRKR